VLHEHTETKSGHPEIYRNRIALDTGADLSGVLTTLVFEENKNNRFLVTAETKDGTAVARKNTAVFLTLADVEDSLVELNLSFQTIWLNAR
jgi:hypothetical protein